MKLAIFAGASALVLSGCTGVIGTPTVDDPTMITAPALSETILAGEFDASVEILRAACAEGEDWQAALYVVRPSVALGEVVLVAPTPDEFSTLCDAAAVRMDALEAAG